jgi:hypothetical protein
MSLMMNLEELYLSYNPGIVNYDALSECTNLGSVRRFNLV